MAIIKTKAISVAQRLVSMHYSDMLPIPQVMIGYSINQSQLIFFVHKIFFFKVTCQISCRGFVIDEQLKPPIQLLAWIVLHCQLRQGLISYIKSCHLGDIPGILINPCLHLSVQLARRKPPCTIRQNASTFFIEALIVL